MIIGDLGAFYVALGIAYFFRVKFLGHWSPFPFPQTFEDLAVRIWMPLVVIIVFSFEGLYSKRVPFWEETRIIVRSIFLSYLGIFSIVSLGKLSGEISRAIVIGTGIVSLGFTPLVRFQWKPFLHQLGIGIKNTLLVGDNPIGQLAQSGLSRDHYMGLRLIGFVKVSEEDKGFNSNVAQFLEEGREYPLKMNVPKLPSLGPIERLPEIVDQKCIRGAVVALPHIKGRELGPLIEKIQRYVLSVYVIPNLTQVNLLNSELLYLFYEEMFLVGIHNNLKSRVNRLGKSIFDLVVSLVLLIPLFLFFSVIAISVALSSPGPIIFTQARVGKNGKIFRIYKFRTMYEGAEEMMEELFEHRPDLKMEFEKSQKLSNDPRVTPVGRILRKTSLDELPQLFNVLRGEMSLVGPRPVTLEEFGFRYHEVGEDYCLVKPGMTGLWQVSGRSETGYELRIRLDLWYIRNWSLWLDIVILMRTVGVVLTRKGAI